MKTLDSLNAVRKVSASLKDLYDKARHVGADPENKEAAQADRHGAWPGVDKMESVNLHGVLKTRMTQRVRDLNPAVPSIGAGSHELPASSRCRRRGRRRIAAEVVSNP